MSIERLNWDSQFFGIEVGSTSREQLLTVPDAEVNKYDLLYLKEKKPIEGNAFLPNRDNLLVDCKLIYSKQISDLSFSTNYTIKEYSSSLLYMNSYIVLRISVGNILDINWTQTLLQASLKKCIGCGLIILFLEKWQIIYII